MFATVLFYVYSSLLLLSFTDTVTAQRNGDLRLVGSSLLATSSGRLEIYIYGQWGTVCDDSFSFTDANVACRQLGYSGASRSPISVGDTSLVGAGFGPIWLDDVGCFGSESCLLSCSNGGIGSHNCNHFEDVVIFCSGSRITSARDCRSTLADVRVEERAARQAGAIVGAFLGVLLLLSVTWCVTLCICMRVSTCPLHDRYHKMTTQNLQASMQSHEVQTGGTSILPPAQPQTQQTTF